MDSLTYHYYTSVGGTYNPTANSPTATPTNSPYNATNRLAYVEDAVNSSNYDTGIDNQNAGNYAYDRIGNLIKDYSKGMVIEWNMQNKVVHINKSNMDIFYEYDALVNRVRKSVQTASETKETYYSRDAQGNTLSTYTTVVGAAFTQESVTLYGSARLGEYRPHEQDQQAPERAKSLPAIADGLFYRKRGYVHYELTNHLGNVLATVSDRKLISTPSFYVADIVSLQDYYAFGMEMPERGYNAETYRYGFNGKENDKETGWQDYGFRLYDKRICRFPSVDPLTKKYPELTPYQFASNTPIMAVDLDGLESLTYDENLKIVAQKMQTNQVNFGLLINKVEQETYDKTIWIPVECHVPGILVLVVTHSPSEGIHNIIDNTCQKWTLECAAYCNVLHLGALLYTIGNKEFDDYITGQIPQQTGCSPNFFKLTPSQDMAGIRVENSITRGAIDQSFSDQDDMNKTIPGTEEEVLSNTPVGSKITVHNFKSMDEKMAEGLGTSGWINENMIKIGNDSYAAQGIGVGVSLQEVKEVLATKYLQQVEQTKGHRNYTPSASEVKDFAKNNVGVLTINTFKKTTE